MDAANGTSPWVGNRRSSCLEKWDSPPARGRGVPLAVKERHFTEWLTHVNNVNNVNNVNTVNTVNNVN